MKTTIEGCTLEIDHDRGVVYVHNPKGFTSLRICGIKDVVAQPCDQIDITLRPNGKTYVAWASGSSLDNVASVGQPDSGTKISSPAEAVAHVLQILAIEDCNTIRTGGLLREVLPVFDNTFQVVTTDKKYEVTVEEAK